jgi:hypothetical protein
MNPEQRSTGPLPKQTDPDSSPPDAEPGQRTLTEVAWGWSAVEPTEGGARRHPQVHTNRRCARPVRSQESGGLGSLRSQDDRRCRSAP